MKVLFTVDRDLYYKFYAPIIEELLARGHTVHLAHDYGQPRFPPGQKFMAFPNLFKVPQFLRTDKLYSSAFKGTAELASLIVENRVDLVVSLSSRSHYHIPVEAVAGVRWATLQHWGDNFTAEKEEVMDCDLLLLCGEHWWEGFRQSRFAVNLASAEAAKKPRIEYCGCPYHDSAATMEPAQIRMKYGIPSERPVLLYLPLGLARPSSDVRWQRLIRFWLLRKYGCDDRRLLDRLTASCFAPFASWNVSELSLMRAMREFCDRQDVCLVLKGRVKKPISEATCALADLVLYDETFHPTTMTELLSVSELLVTHFSMAVFEAMNIGVYNINIGLGPMFDAQVALIDDLFPGDWREDLTTSGVNEIQDAADFIRSFGESQLADYHLDGVSQQAAAAKYFSCPPGKATKQCVDALLE